MLEVWMDMADIYLKMADTLYLQRVTIGQALQVWYIPMQLTERQAIPLRIIVMVLQLFGLRRML
ncbi:hypothetical protein MBAV_001535 [Candidatus Magnetobacterium bavaricum]|uniref:Uncharacterized protein n=1 Tax=Candidatus Magnetobacterium bavaricum TaxID=29290 RepID=A0A0F3GWL8_9BACT|nr:hypothetical protein MBAV_001535 [Candidatus Magnetobacterium bavaricum]